MGICQQCGHVNPESTRDCERCAGALQAPAGAPRSAKLTMMGMPAPDFSWAQTPAEQAASQQTAQAIPVVATAPGSPSTGRPGSFGTATLFGLAPPTGGEAIGRPTSAKKTLMGVAMLAPAPQAPVSRQAPPAPMTSPNALGRTLLGGHAAAAWTSGPQTAPRSPGGTQIGFADPSARAADEAFGNEKTPALSFGAVGGAVAAPAGPSGTFPGGSGPGNVLQRVPQEVPFWPP
ncbi:MAG: hypothetical protein RJA70_3990, partial [Pseudomonadota bacterium]